MTSINNVSINHEASRIASTKSRLEVVTLSGFVLTPDPYTFDLTTNQAMLLGILMKCERMRFRQLQDYLNKSSGYKPRMSADYYFQCTDEYLRKSHALPNTQRCIRDTLRELTTMEVVTTVSRGAPPYRWVSLDLSKLPLRSTSLGKMHEDVDASAGAPMMPLNSSEVMPLNPSNLIPLETTTNSQSKVNLLKESDTMPLKESKMMPLYKTDLLLKQTYNKTNKEESAHPAECGSVDWGLLGGEDEEQKESPLDPELIELLQNIKQVGRLKFILPKPDKSPSKTVQGIVYALNALRCGNYKTAYHWNPEWVEKYQISFPTVILQTWQAVSELVLPALQKYVAEQDAGVSFYKPDNAAQFFGYEVFRGTRKGEYQAHFLRYLLPEPIDHNAPREPITRTKPQRYTDEAAPFRVDIEVSIREIIETALWRYQARTKDQWTSAQQIAWYRDAAKLHAWYLNHFAEIYEANKHRDAMQLLRPNGEQIFQRYMDFIDEHYEDSHSFYPYMFRQTDSKWLEFKRDLWDGNSIDLDDMRDPVKVDKAAERLEELQRHLHFQLANKPRYYEDKSKVELYCNLLSDSVDSCPKPTNKNYYYSLLLAMDNDLAKSLAEALLDDYPDLCEIRVDAEHFQNLWIKEYGIQGPTPLPD